MSISANKKYSRNLDSVLIQELNYNMFVATKSPFRSRDLGIVLRKTFRSGFNLESINKKIVEMDLLKEVMQLLSKRKFEEVRRMELKQKISRNNWYLLYTIVLKNKEENYGFVALIIIPEIFREIEKSHGVIFAAKHYIGVEEVTEFEKAKFENYQQEVKPQIEILGNLYKRTRRL